MSIDQVKSRLAFMEIDERQQATIASVRPLVKSLIGRALDRFYARASMQAETARHFRDPKHMASAKVKQEAHWMSIASGRFDESFYTSVRRIGTVHARIGLEPRWYIGAYALVLEDLIAGIGRHYRPWRRALSLFRMPSATQASIAIVKAALLDMELSVSIYFEEAQIERNAAISATAHALDALAQGDLTTDLTGLPANFLALEQSYNKALGQLRGLIGVVSESADAIGTGSDEIAHASEDLARRTESNAASLEEAAAAIAQIDERLRASVTAAEVTVERADEARGMVGSGRAIADEAVQAMGRVAESAKGIDDVIEGLDKIAFQTRVLAMNAAVEAGRAGDAGRGFAVVADLVSALAMRAEEEAKRARDQLTVTQAEIVVAVDAVQKVDSSFSGISDGVSHVHESVGSMASGNHAQASAIAEIAATITMIDQSTQQNAAMVEQTSAAARNLASEVVNLTNQSAQFKTTTKPIAHRVPQKKTRTPTQQTGGARPRSVVSAKPLRAAAVPASMSDDDAWQSF
ncbi:MAG: protoglobin domain-containing protein [Sphingobium sp.]|uniref:protoglobin domain-containing protein n=1 Tax=Sphingobium sp. CECT 9361 TaxID=2845384 RepID=UPI001E33E7AE|nr:protoglobin domain-containing protein [Sphingobium sp. CECT 9361]CAH0356147.1 hypothetical protein SPH9361_03909 [Sphingobium sp. CECT 9361]